MGWECGLVKHWVLGNSQGLFHYGRADSWDEIRSLLKRFERSIAVIDALPDLTEPRRLREEFPGRVFLCHYAKDRKTFQLIRWGANDEFGNVVADRNRLLQLVIDEFADSRIPLQGQPGDWAEFYSHWKTLYRLNDVDALGNPKWTWETSTGEDHYCHATAYWRIGMDRIGVTRGQITKPDLIDEQNRRGVVVQGDQLLMKPPEPVYHVPNAEEWRQ